MQKQQQRLTNYMKAADDATRKLGITQSRKVNKEKSSEDRMLEKDEEIIYIGILNRRQDITTSFQQQCVRHVHQFFCVSKLITQIKTF